MPNFDVIVGNPPYNRNTHLKFLELAYNISKEWIIWVHPSVWLLHEEGLKSYRYYKDLIKNHTLEMTLFNGNPLFNVMFFSPFVMDVINKKIDTNGLIKVIDKLKNIEVEYKDINDINKWSEIKVYPPLNQKIRDLARDNNLEKNWNIDRGSYYINLSYVRGNVDLLNSDKIVKTDFYTIVPRDLKIENKKNKPIWFSFETKEEAKNFLNFLKTRWAMFSLSFNKINQHFKGGALRTIPWLDWSRPWTEKDFEELIDATPEEIAFVKGNIPDYYGIKKKD